MSYTGWFMHNPSLNLKPVSDGVWVKVIDYDNNLLEGWSEEFDWSWKVDPLGNIIRYSIRESKGVTLLKEMVSIIPEKGRVDILVNINVP